MNLATMQFFSAALNRHVTYSAILPETDAGPHPVLMQLHGLTDDHTAWLHFSGLVRHARPYPFLIVLPDGGTSFYLNRDPSQRYEDFLMQDLWKHVTDTFHVRPGRWAIGGLSMGGFRAMRLGCKYPDRFASVYAHSGAYRDPSAYGITVANPDDASVFRTVERLMQQHDRPAISFDCGTEDHLLGHNRELHAHMEKLGLAHRYREYSGGHTWPYWDEHVQEALAQHAAVLA